jgi:hypothetical protein
VKGRELEQSYGVVAGAEVDGVGGEAEGAGAALAGRIEALK